MELRVLKYFLAVAQEETITGAANCLHVTQPTLSRQIRDLEEELGQQLLVRGSHRVTLTPEGMLLRSRAEEIVSMSEKMREEFAAMRGGMVRGDIYVGGGETEAVKLVAEAATALQQKHPGIRYHLYSGNAEDVTERLDKGLLDFGILIQPARLTKYHSMEIPAKDVWGVILRRDHPLAQRESICREDLLHVPLICSRQALWLRGEGNEFAEWFGENFDKLNIAATFNLLYNAALMVEAGMGCAVTIDRIAPASPDSPLCFRPLTPKLEAGLNLVWKKERVFSPAAELFLQELSQRFLQQSAAIR